MWTPKYRKRPDRDYAFVEIGGKRHPLPGKANSPESLAAYHEFIQQLLSGEPESRVPKVPRGAVAVTDLVAAFLDFAKIYYMKDGKPGTEYGLYKQAAKALHRSCGDVNVDQFGPALLKKVRDALVTGSYLRPDEKGKPLIRKVVNRQVGRIRRIFRWGVENEMVQASVLEKLKAVAPLRKGKTAAKDRPKVKPASREAIDAVLAEVTPIVAAMIRLQELTGMRSENLCELRPGEIDRSGNVWLYSPARHKTDYRNDGDGMLTIFLGPRAQEILLPFLDRPADVFCFSPRESEEQRAELRRQNRKSKVTPSQVARGVRAERHGRRKLRTNYTPASYRRSIWYAVERINKRAAKEAQAKGRQPPPKLAAWHPHQLRHGVASDIRKRFGLEGAQVYLGHANADVTQIYAERDLELARRIAREVG